MDECPFKDILGSPRMGVHSMFKPLQFDFQVRN